MKKVIRKMIFYIVASLVIFIFLKTTTMGWRWTKSYFPSLSEEETVTRKNLEDIVRHLSQSIGDRSYQNYDNLNEAAQYLQRLLKNYGYTPQVQTFFVHNKEYQNIFAVKHAGQSTDDYYIIGAHYDTCANPGADDNASGVAGVLELARLLQYERIDTNMMFVLFANEEPPFFQTDHMGSRYFVNHLTQEEIRVNGAIILEMIGYYSNTMFSQQYLPLIGPFFPNKANFVAVISNFASIDFMKQVRKLFQESTQFPVESLVAPSHIPGIDYSDHASFWRQKINAVMITDTAYLRNKNYHRASDTPDTLDFSSMAEVTHGLKDTILRMNNE